MSNFNSINPMFNFKAFYPQTLGEKIGYGISASVVVGLAAAYAVDTFSPDNVVGPLTQPPVAETHVQKQILTQNSAQQADDSELEVSVGSKPVDSVVQAPAPQQVMTAPSAGGLQGTAAARFAGINDHEWHSVPFNAKAFKDNTNPDTSVTATHEEVSSWSDAIDGLAVGGLGLLVVGAGAAGVFGVRHLLKKRKENSAEAVLKNELAQEFGKILSLIDQGLKAGVIKLNVEDRIQEIEKILQSSKTDSEKLALLKTEGPLLAAALQETFILKAVASKIGILEFLNEEFTALPIEDPTKLSAEDAAKVQEYLELLKSAIDDPEKLKEAGAKEEEMNALIQKHTRKQHIANYIVGLDAFYSQLKTDNVVTPELEAKYIETRLAALDAMDDANKDSEVEAKQAELQPLIAEAYQKAEAKKSKKKETEARTKKENFVELQQNQQFISRFDDLVNKLGDKGMITPEIESKLKETRKVAQDSLTDANLYLEFLLREMELNELLRNAGFLTATVDAQVWTDDSLSQLVLPKSWDEPVGYFVGGDVMNSIGVNLNSDDAHVKTISDFLNVIAGGSSILNHNSEINVQAYPAFTYDDVLKNISHSLSMLDDQISQADYLAKPEQFEAAYHAFVALESQGRGMNGLVPGNRYDFERKVQEVKLILAEHLLEEVSEYVDNPDDNIALKTVEHYAGIISNWLKEIDYANGWTKEKRKIDVSVFSAELVIVKTKLAELALKRIFAILAVLEEGKIKGDVFAQHEAEIRDLLIDLGNSSDLRIDTTAMGNIVERLKAANTKFYSHETAISLMDDDTGPVKNMGVGFVSTRTSKAPTSIPATDAQPQRRAIPSRSNAPTMIPAPARTDAPAVDNLNETPVSQEGLDRVRKDRRSVSKIGKGADVPVSLRHDPEFYAALQAIKNGFDHTQDNPLDALKKVMEILNRYKSNVKHFDLVEAMDTAQEFRVIAELSRAKQDDLAQFDTEIDNIKDMIKSAMRARDK